MHANRKNNAFRLGTIGIAIFVCCCLFMHFVQPELSPVDDAVSYYMNGSFGWVLGFGLICLGVGSLIIAYGLGVTENRMGFLLLVIWGVGVIVGGVFPPDPRGQWSKPPSVSGMIHGGAAMVAFLVFPFAAWLLSKRLGRFAKAFALMSGACLIAFIACLAPVFTHHAPHMLGLMERILLLVYVSWLLTACFKVRNGQIFKIN